MGWLILTLCIGVPLTAGGIYLVEVMTIGVGIPLTILVGFATVILSILLIANIASRHMTVESCKNWSHETGRPAKFASYTWWTYGCITPTGNGHWIPITKVIVNHVKTGTTTS